MTDISSLPPAVRSADVASPDELTSQVSPAAFLLFLKRKMAGLDNEITSIQGGLQSQIDEQSRLQGIRRELEHLQRVGDAIGGDGLIAYNPDDHAGDLIDGVSPARWLEDHPDVRAFLQVESGSNVIQASTVREAMTNVDGAISRTKQDTELRMIEFQTLMQDRASTIQLVSNCINSMNETTKAIVGNVR